MSYKIRITGEKEPVIVLDDKQGYQIEQDWLGGKLKGQKIVIGSGSYEGGDVRSVVKFDEDKTIVKQEYSKQELDTFGDDTRAFTLEKGTPDYYRIVEEIKEVLQNETAPMYAPLTVEFIIRGREEVNADKEKLNEVANRIVDDRMVGRLYKSGWEKYLVSQMAIVLGDNGQWIIVWDSGGAKLPKYEDLLEAYSNREARREYIELQRLKEYEDTGIAF